MKSFLRWTIIIVAVGLAIGCIETTTLVTVNKDGSGSVSQTVLISTALTELLAGMAVGATVPNTLDEDRLNDMRDKAEEMGVKLVDAQPLISETGAGFTAIYEFKDINKVRINQNPGDLVPTPAGASDPEDQIAEYITFQFTPGNPATLVVINPKEEPDFDTTEEDQSQEAADEMMPDMVSELFKGMRINIAVEVVGSVVDTDATYVDGSTITMMDMDFGILLSDEETFKTLARANPQSLAETKELVENAAGIRIELQDRIEVRFR